MTGRRVGRTEGIRKGETRSRGSKESPTKEADLTSRAQSKRSSSSVAKKTAYCVRGSAISPSLHGEIADQLADRLVRQRERDLTPLAAALCGLVAVDLRAAVAVQGDFVIGECLAPDRRGVAAQLSDLLL